MSGEPEVVDFVPGSRADDPLFQALSPDDPFQSGPINTVQAHPGAGYDQRDTEVAISLAGAAIDDAAATDADRDNAKVRGERLLAVIYLPMDMATCGQLLMAFGDIPGTHLRDDDGAPATEIHIYGPA